MATRSVATVFGGSGFLGRYVVKRLAQQGHVVRVAVRRPSRANELRPMGRVGQVVPLYASLADEPSVAQAVEGADVVVNLVGILAEAKAGDFMRVHADGAGRVARLSAAAGVSALVQMSAIGASALSPSGYGRSKHAGEEAVQSGFPGAVVLRPSIVFGPEDAFFNRFAGIARFTPVFPLFCGNTKFQPVYAGDVAEAVMRSIDGPGFAGGIFELGGPRVWSFRELMAWMLHEIRRKPRMFEVPMGLARLQASILEHVPGKPLTRDQLAMLERDNVVAEAADGFDAFGIAPTPLELIVPGYLDRYRPGGGRREIPR